MTQNEKDRELLDMCASNRENGWCIDTMGDEGDMLYEIANRLLTERENAEVVYKKKNPGILNVGFWAEYEVQDYMITNPRISADFQKGVWIPVEEGLIE